MKKSKKIISKFVVSLGLVTLVASFISGVIVATPGVAHAADPMCYVLIPLQQDNYYRSTPCPDDASIDKNNDSSKTGTCYYLPSQSQRSGSKAFIAKNCLEIFASNKACLTVTATHPSCYSEGSVDGTGGSVAANTPTGSDIPISKPAPCDGSTPEKLTNCLKTNPIVVLMQVAMNFLAIGVGVVVVTMVVIGGIQYSASGGNPQTVQEAKKKIYNAAFALVVFFFLYAALQWLVPGGIF